MKMPDDELTRALNGSDDASVAMRQRFLERCPDLRGKVDENVARRFVAVKYDRDHNFNVPPPPPAPQPPQALRVILFGHVTLVQRRGHEQVTRSCGPMATFGEEIVKAWSEPTPASGAPIPEIVNAFTKSVTYVLELPEPEFDHVPGLRSTDEDSLRARILEAYDVHEIAPDIVRTLALRPELVEVDDEGLYQLLEGAEIRHVEAGELLAPAGAIPPAFYVLLEQGNAFELRTPGKGPYDVSTVPAPACSGIAYLIKDQPLDAAIHVQREGTVVVLSDRAFWQLFRFNTDFQRAIIRSNNLDVRVRDGRGPKVDPSDTSVFLIMQKDGLSLPLRGLTDLLADSLVTHLYDNVLVVHAVPKPAPGQPTTAKPRVRFGEPGAPWLEHIWIEIGESLVGGLMDARKRYAAARDEADGRPDVTLIETSELPNLRSFFRDFDKLDTLDTTFKVVHLTDRPDALPPIELIAAGASILYAGVLAEAPPTLGVGAAAYFAEGVAAAATISPTMAAKARATIGETLSIAKKTVTFAGRLVHGIKERQSLGRGNLPAAWPLGTVRLRLPEALRAALRARANQPPTRFADLGDAIAGQARPTMDRWARAVTTRRVGLALGGGGTYGDVHVPFIKALAKERVPIDMVSGSSVGSTIGAYYCGLDLEGLDLYWSHRSMLLAAGAFGIVSSIGVEVAMTYDLGQLDLAQTEIPFFPVVTDADVGVESYLSKGTFAVGVRASGSLPPLLGPTVQGDRRYLDGGLVANVPVNVLVAEGAALIVASNPIARLEALDRKQPFDVPLVGVLLRESNPLARFQDAKRMVPMIFGVAGQSQAVNADVMFRPSEAEAGLLNSQHPDFQKIAFASVLLKKAVADVANKWRASLGHPPERVRITKDDAGRSVLTVDGWDGWIGFVGANATIDPVSRPLLQEIADFLGRHPEVLKVRVEVRTTGSVSATKLAERVRSVLAERGVKPERLGIEQPQAGAASSGAKANEAAPEPQVSFPIERNEDLQEALAKQRAELEATRRELLAAQRRADGETLTRHAREQATSGDLDLAGLLAIEASKRTWSPSLDEALRGVLGRRGQMERSIVVEGSGDTRDVAWGHGGDLLAVGSCDGVLRIWDTRAAESKLVGAIDHSLQGTAKAIRGLSFSTTNDLIATAGLDSQASVHQVVLGPSNSFELKRDPILRLDVAQWDQRAVALSPEGKRVLLTPGKPSTLAVFDLEIDPASATLRCRFQGEADVHHAAWEPGGDRIAAAMTDGTAVIWSATTAEVLEKIETGGHGPVRVAWHPSAGVLAVACEATATIHDLRAAKAQREKPLELDGHRRQIIGLAWSHDGSRLVTTSKDLTARIWDAGTGALQMSLRSLEGHLVGAAFHPGNVNRITTWDELGKIVVWDAGTGEARTTLRGHGKAINDARWSPRGARLATTSTDGTARIWSPEKIGQAEYVGHADSMDPRLIVAAFAPTEADRLVTAGNDGSVHVWSASDGARRAELASAATSAGPADARFSPSGALIAVTQALVATPLVFETSGFTAAIALAPPPVTDPRAETDPPRIHWSPDGRYLAVKRRKSVVIWCVATGAIERVIENESRYDITSCAWSPAEGRLELALSLWTGGAALELWDATGTRARRWQAGFGDGVWSVDWSADGSRIAAACNNGFASILDAGTGAIVTSRKLASSAKVVALSPDGRWLATGDDAKVMTVWDCNADGWTSVSGEGAHGSRIRQVTWSKDPEQSRSLVSVSEDGLVCLWERRGEGADTRFVNVSTLRGARGSYQVVGVSPDERSIVTGDDEGGALIHPVSADDLVAAVGKRLGREALTDAEWSQYLPGRKVASPAVGGEVPLVAAKS
jgi:WD40 repeat protein/predicted acylesterase/phospholipase RssA